MTIRICTGTVVDSGICHPINYDLYMCGHTGRIVSILSMVYTKGPFISAHPKTAHVTVAVRGGKKTDLLQYFYYYYSALRCLISCTKHTLNKSIYTDVIALTF